MLSNVFMSYLPYCNYYNYANFIDIFAKFIFSEFNSSPHLI
jgi:hypothetical protein